MADTVRTTLVVRIVRMDTSEENHFRILSLQAKAKGQGDETFNARE